MIEAGVTRACAARSRWVHLVEVAKDNLDRCVHAVEVEPVETGLRRVRPKPPNEVEDLGVPPHPCWKSRECRERLLRGAFAVPHVLVDAKGVGPIGLDRESVEALPRDE